MPEVDSPFSSDVSINIPDHELLRLIGRGSYGDVWLARNIMGSFRAVKIIRRNNFDHDSPFEREIAGIKRFEPISRTHEGFVDVLQIGRNDNEGQLYYVMEAADDLEQGQSIDPDKYVPKTLGKALVRVKRFPVEECVQMGMALCQALEHLHRQGLVHRDIKPSNIVFVNGAPKLADIGLVTDSNNARSFVGTEGFIPPEGPGSPQADIYSLGKALYEIASGRDRLDFPALPAGLADFPDREQFLELNEALIRACRQKAEDRYQSVREMYEDLALLASQKSLRRLRILERRWQRTKHSILITAGVLAGAAAIAYPFVRERQHAEEIRERQIGVSSAKGIHKMDEGDLPGALLEFAEIFRLESSRKERFLANQVRVASILAEAPKLAQMLFLSNGVSSAEISKDARRILTVEKGNCARIHDLASGNLISEFAQSSRTVQASFSPDGQFVVVANESGWASIFNLKTREETRLSHPGNVMCGRFSPSGKLVATACNDGIARIWSATTGELLKELKGHKSTVRSVAFNSDETILVSGGNDYTARLWRVTSGEAASPPMPHSGWVVDAAFDPDSKTIVTADTDGWAKRWNVATGEELPSLMKHVDMVSQVAFSPDGLTILTASTDSTLRFWDAKTTRPLLQNHLLRHSGAVLAAGFSAEGQRVVTGCEDGIVRVWELAKSENAPVPVDGSINSAGSAVAILGDGCIKISSLLEPDAATNRIDVNGKVRELAISENGKSIAAIVTPTDNQSSETINVWDVHGNGQPLNITAGSRGSASRPAFSPDGALFAFKDGSTVRVFDIPQITEWRIEADLANSAVITFHPTKRRFAIGTGGSVAVFDAPEGGPIYPPVSVPGGIQHLAFSPDGKLVLVSQTDQLISRKSAVLIEVETGKLHGPEVWHRDGILQGAWSPDGRRFITGGEDREALIWNTDPPRESVPPLPPLVHAHQVSSVAFSSNGRWIGTTCNNRTVRIWESDTGFPLTPPLDCDGLQSQITFLPDGLRFVTTQTSTKFWLWTLMRIQMPPDDVISLSHLLNNDLRVRTTQIAESWKILKKKYPQQFSASKSQIARWHTEKYKQAKAESLPYAMSFHLRQLRTLDPENQFADLASASEASAQPGIE